MNRIIVFPMQSLVEVALSGSLLGVVIGFLSILFVHLFMEWISSIRSRRNLRQALIAELQASSSILERLSPEIADVVSILDDVPRAIFEGNADNIGRLSEDEIIKVTSFYSEIKSHRLRGEETMTSYEKIDKDIEDLRKIVSDRELTQNFVKEIFLNEEIEGKSEEEIKELVIDETDRVISNIERKIDIYAKMEEDGVGSGLVENMNNKRKVAIAELEDNLEPTIRAEMVSDIKGFMKAVYRTIIPEGILQYNSWNDMSPRVVETLLLVAHMYNTQEFTLRDYKNRLNDEEDLKDIFNSDSYIGGRITLEVLATRGLLDRVDTKTYKINQYNSADIILEYTNESDKINKDKIELGWVP